MTAASIRLAEAADLAAINEIYNHYVASSTTTYDEQPMTLRERRQWFDGRAAEHPATVAERDGQIVGYGSLHPFRARPGHRFTVEDSVYVRPECLRQGIGSMILADLIQRARSSGLHAIVAGIDAEQAASVALHAKHGFREVARFPQIGRKYNRWLDVIFMQLLLE
ncbi:MAG TPA: N-acetyltransferase family protein [Lacipirellulaceae bacterium]|nr:N-acetyltransferase family protein [Lacipirellulaceae bacterium]